MRGFRIEGADLVAEVDAQERAVLAATVADVAELLGAGRIDEQLADTAEPVGFRLRLDPIPTPEDPAVHRLLPDASRDDPELTSEFRRLTEDDLRQEKTERLIAFHRALHEDGPFRIPRAQAHRLAATLTDLRLVLAQRLQIVDEESSAELEELIVTGELDPADEFARMRHYLGSLYLAIGWWQETLMGCLLAGLPSES
ncbi:DUF2017 family protein [Cellulomonas sp. NPDC089187]|uniref:DUF2017 family protein n=1 Tax=Cellulomonas sp. NPDC089187 TaxID=3154970 RepID=UPI00341269C9